MADVEPDAGSQVGEDFKLFVKRIKTTLEAIDKRVRRLHDQGHREEYILAAERDSVFKVMKEGNGFLCDTVKYFTPDEHAIHEQYFREKVAHLAAGSAIMHRAQSRPLGYAGDYEMMRMCYDNTYEGSTLLGKILHKYSTELPMVQAIRNRRELIAQFAQGKRRILSVACGPACEVALVSASYPKATFSFTLLDQDKEALDFARARLSGLSNVDISYVNISVYSMMKQDDLGAQLGKFDCIYSMGLFDYLNDKAAKKLCCRLVDMLGPDGTLIVGNYHARCANRWETQYWCDWTLQHRTEESMLDLVPDLGADHQSEILYEQTRAQMFLKIQKTSMLSKL